MYIHTQRMGTSPVVQCLGLGTFTADGLGLSPGWGTKTPQTSWPKFKKKKHTHTVRTSE